MSEKSTFVESSRGKPLMIRKSYKYFLAYESKSRWSRWGYCLTICQTIISSNKTEDIVKNNSKIIFEAQEEILQLLIWIELSNLYDCTIGYSSHLLVRIGQWTFVSGIVAHLSSLDNHLNCVALMTKWNCHYQLRLLLHSLLRGETQESRHFLANTRKYNIAVFKWLRSEDTLSKNMNLIRHSGFS